VVLPEASTGAQPTAAALADSAIDLLLAAQGDAGAFDALVPVAKRICDGGGRMLRREGWGMPN
jgi:hypothetical protein